MVGAPGPVPRLSLLGLLVAGCPRTPQVVPPPPGLALPEQGLTAGDLQEIRDRVVPMVEEAAGRRFDEVPFVGLGTADGLARIVREDSLIVLGGVYGLPEEVVHEMARTDPLQVSSLIGKYAPRGGTLYIAPDSIEAMVAEGVVEADQREAVLELIIAHELTHALQDQEQDLVEQLASRRDDEALRALQAVTEGQATRVEELVAERLGHTELFWELVELQGWGPEGLVEPMAWPIWAQYGQGRDYVIWLEAEGGTDRVWRAVREPPQSTTALWRPEREDVGLAGPPELLDGVEAVLTAGEWVALGAHLGEWDLRRVLYGVDDEVLDDALAPVRAGSRLTAYRDDRRCEVWVVVLDEPAEELVDLVRQTAEQVAQTLEPAGLAVADQAFTALPADDALARVVAPAGPHSASVETASVWMARGERLVVIEVEGFRPGLRMERALELVWSRLEADEPGDH